MNNKKQIAHDERVEVKIHQVFDATLLMKGIHAAIEIAGGVALYFVSAATIVKATAFLLNGELTEDPHDAVASYFLHAAQNFGAGGQSFAALYLLSHGIINALVVVSLWREKLWAYPLSFAVTVGFMIYQIYLLTFGYSLWLVILTVFDIFMLYLIWHEYGVIKKKNAL
jgi:uncharacterized membrane protein